MKLKKFKKIMNRKLDLITLTLEDKENDLVKTIGNQETFEQLMAQLKSVKSLLNQQDSLFDLDKELFTKEDW